MVHLGDHNADLQRSKDQLTVMKQPSILWISLASLVVQTVKNPPAVWETWVQSLGWDDPLKKGTSTHSSILAWRIPWTEEPGGLQSMGLQRVGHNRVTFIGGSDSKECACNVETYV